MKTFALLRAAMALLILAGFIGVVAVRPAQAQRPLRLTLGISTPVRHGGSTSQGLLFGQGGGYTATAPFLIAGISYDVTRRRSDEERRPVYSVYLDNGVTFDIFSPSATYSGVGVSARYQKAGQRFYYGGGLGLYRLDTGNDAIGGGSGRRTAPGGKVFVGWQGRGAFFGQIDATLLPSVNGDNLSNAALLLGLRL